MSVPAVVGIISFTAGSARNGKAWPPHLAGDVLVIPGETAAELFPFSDVPGGWAQIANSPVSTGTAGGTDSTRVSGWWCRATSDSMPDIPAHIPTPAVNHIGYAGILLRGCVATGNPIVLTPTGAVVAVAATPVSAPGGTTVDANCLIVGFFAHGKDTALALFDPAAWGGTGLTNITQHINASTGAGNGGGLAIVTGEKATAGAYGPMTGALTQAAVQACFTFAVKGEAGAPPAAAASDFVCGPACGITDPGPATSPDRRHYHARGGAIPTTQTAIARNGGRAFEFAPINDVSYLQRNCADPARVLRLYYRWASPMPTTDCELIRFIPAAGPDIILLYRAATQDVVGKVGEQVTAAQAVVPGLFYRFELAGDVSGTTRTAKFTCAVDDAAGVDKGTASLTGQVTSFISSWRFGASCLTPTTAKVYIQDLRASALATAYPMGAGRVIGLQATADGVHIFSASGDFKYDGLTNVPVDPEGLTWEYLAGLLDANAANSFLAASAVSAGEYLEWVTGGMPAGTVGGLELVTLHKGSDLNPHKQTLRMIDGGTTVDVFTDADFSETSVVQHSKHYATAPSGGAWTQAKINAPLTFRWGSSWTAVDIAGVPHIAGLMMEVELTTGGGGDPNTSTAQNPAHVYAAPGTYNVKLTVTDDDGLTDTITHPVTVT